MKRCTPSAPSPVPNACWPKSANARKLARRIVDGAATVHIFGEDIAVRAQIWTINGFSAHADQPSLLAWLGNAPRRKVLLVHGEYERGMQAMHDCLAARGIACQLPGLHEPIRID